MLEAIDRLGLWRSCCLSGCGMLMALVIVSLSVTLFVLVSSIPLIVLYQGACLSAYNSVIRPVFAHALLMAFVVHCSAWSILHSL